MVIFGLSTFAQVMGVFHPGASFTVHKRFVLPGSGALEFETLPPSKILLAIGPGKLCKNRENVFKECLERGHTMTGWMSPGAEFHKATVDLTTIIFELNNLQPYTHIGANTVLWSMNHIGHHTRIGEHCFITSHVAIGGSCKIGNNVFIGMNATICHEVTVGNECFIAAGAVVDRDMPDGTVWTRKGLSKIPACEVDAL